MKLQLSVVTVALFSTVLISSQAINATEAYSPHVDDKGNISFPENFKVDMVHLGSWFVPEGGASGFHDVYTEKESVDIFRETGKFPDGATLVKELRGAESADYSTGPNVSYASTENLKQWFVMVKDSTNRFPGNPLWGKGWGWALFKPDNPSLNVATNHETDCLACHIPVADKDLIYTEAYPVLFGK